MDDRIRVSMTRRCGGQVARVLRRTTERARAVLSSQVDRDDMAAVLAVVEDIERQLNTQHVQLKVIDIRPLEREEEKHGG